MSSTAITTVVKMMESLPETAQDHVADHLREFIADLGDDLRWDRLFAKTQGPLAAAASRAREQIAGGKESPDLQLLREARAVHEGWSCQPLRS